jgi:hypothetical protein
MIAAIEKKKLAAINESQDLKHAVTLAREANLSVVSVVRAHKAATSRVTYLSKLEAALRSGYVMMPDMPGDVIAVRINRDLPSRVSRRVSRNTWPSSVPDETPDCLPTGEGRYVSPSQTIQKAIHSVETTRDGKEDVRYGFRAVALRDPFGLDKLFVKPIVIQRTAAAMALKIFDEVVTIKPQNTQKRRSKDPIVLGRVVDKVKKTSTAFMIAWFMDLDDI